MSNTSSTTSTTTTTPNIQEPMNTEHVSLTVNTPKIKQTPDMKRSLNAPLTEDEKIEANKLREYEKELDDELAKLKNELNDGSSMVDTMNALHEYNDIKDAAQVVLGAIATMHGVTIASLQKDFDVPCDS
ncbi:DNA repair protein SWI5 homolog [Aphidius gifuensis]|uniref:DNA repair protein SWI5 homolog n=1 Tax=Aphidius gifuensis TaxID=684658 RepID=UPI001CDC6347|nr:DNA repair protein SWI5 homolog [Aphidius gifuensis]